jgi:hypothetical protein
LKRDRIIKKKKESKNNNTSNLVSQIKWMIYYIKERNNNRGKYESDRRENRSEKTNILH